MNGGKDIRLGDDKRTVSIVPDSEQNLYNLANGELLIDEFGNPIITEVDSYFAGDVSAERSTSVIFSGEYSKKLVYLNSQIALETATYGDLDLYVSAGVATTSGSTVGFGSTVSTRDSFVTLEDFSYLEVKTVNDQGGERNKIYFDTTVGITSILKILPGDRVFGKGIPEGTTVSRVTNNSRLILSNNSSISGIDTGRVRIVRDVKSFAESSPVWKISEQFKQTSEVSTTLLGVNRSEVQKSLFANVSSYGFDSDEFEFYSSNSGNSFASWETRLNQIYGNRYNAKFTEETQESGIRLTAFPVPYSYPFGPNFERVGFYNETQFNNYINFIELGNDLYDYFDTGAGSISYPSDWKNKFLPRTYVYVAGGDVVYDFGYEISFAKIDTWTDTWRDIKDGILDDPVTNDKFNFAKVSSILGSSYDSTNTRPGYSSDVRRYCYLQSKKVFRYQPGRISGFTFGLRSSTEPVPGVILEWGISNPTDQYVFKIEEGQFSIVRRSTIPLDIQVLQRNKLTQEDQVLVTSGDPFDTRQYYTVEIPRDKFNGDPLNGNGKSGYLLQPEKVTMYKIEFGWYGAIGARFYAYIPTDNGDARWVVIHTLVIENSLETPCLRNSYFRFKYSLNVTNTADVRTPQYLYKYGTSCYIDGGDDGSSQTYSLSSKQKTISSSKNKSIIGIRPKDYILNRDGIEIENKKIIVPTDLNIYSDSLTEIKIVNCSACPGFGHVYTPGIATTESGRSIDIQFTDPNTISAINDSYFYKDDIGSKIIAPSIYNAYITGVNDQVGTSGSYSSATIKGFGGSYGFNLVNRNIGGSSVLDRVLGVTTTVPIGTPYPHPVRLSNYNAYAASDYAFTGSKIEIQFVNPNNKDDYEHFADFLIGITDKQPVVSGSDTLDGFIVDEAITTTLANSNILYGEHTHAYASSNEDGAETAESFPQSDPQVRMGLDYRIPRLSNPAGGICSKATVEVLNPLRIRNVNEFDYRPDSGLTTPDPEGRRWIQITGSFPNVDYNGGQIAILGTGNVVTVTNSRFVGLTSSYVGGGGTVFSYIEISQTLGSVGSNFTILVRPVQITASGGISQSKIYNYNPFPLYLVAKLKDNASINNISIKETVGDLQRTISPVWYVSSNTTVTNAGGNADLTGVSPTNFKEISRLSSALIDTQNEQSLRPSTTIDTLYVGENSTKKIKLDKVFGVDKNVITPDNNNIEATFITAKKIGSGEGTIETSLNFKEQ